MSANQESPSAFYRAEFSPPRGPTLMTDFPVELVEGGPVAAV